MSNPLNPLLYRTLQRVFGHVRISNEGEAMVSYYAENLLKGRDELVIETAGEYYNVCCDRCNDTRFRLNVNHMWGRRDARGRKNLWLAVCHNENCYEDQQARFDLLDKLSEIEGVLDNARIAPGVEITEAREVEPPGPIFRLDHLPPNHPANRYLAGRFYEPERLGNFYKVGYCPNSIWYLARNRIYIPLYQEGKLKGWQMRYIGDIDFKAEGAPPKYWSCPQMHRGKVLYNLDNAKLYKTGVVMEGPLDVWSLGPMGLGTFGFPITHQQLALLKPHFKHHGVVFLFDPDVLDKPSTARKLTKIQEQLQADNPFPHVFVTLPGGADPGDLDRAFLREYITKEAKGLGMKVSWERR